MTLFMHTSKVVQQGAVKTTKTALCIVLHIRVMWEHYSGAIQGQPRLFQCTKITQNVQQQLSRKIRSALLNNVWPLTHT